MGNQSAEEGLTITLTKDERGLPTCPSVIALSACRRLDLCSLVPLPFCSCQAWSTAIALSHYLVKDLHNLLELL